MCAFLRATGVALALATAASAGAYTYTFTNGATNHYWDESENWVSLDGGTTYPVGADTAIIPEGDTCYVARANAAAATVELSGVIVVSKPLALNVAGIEINSGATLHFLGDLDQDPLYVTGDLLGDIQIDEDLVSDLTIDAFTFAPITVTGDASGTLHIGNDVFDVITVGRTLDGGIYIDGSLQVVGPYQPTIIIDAMGTGSVVIDWDGPNEGIGDGWFGVIRIDDVDYGWQEGNWPDQHLFLTTWCRGDMNDDNTVDGFDIDPFYEAIAGGYEEAYPQFSGSLWYHGDCNVDGYVDGFDIDPFWELVYLGGCYPDGPPEPRGGGLGGEGSELTPETVAGMILANVPSGHLDAVRYITILRIAAGGDEDATAFWEEVLTLLSE
jgi:hypothetical protein